MLRSTTVALVKISVLAFYWRIFNHSSIRLPIWILTVIVISWLIARVDCLDSWTTTMVLTCQIDFDSLSRVYPVTRILGQECQGKVSSKRPSLLLCNGLRTLCRQCVTSAPSTAVYPTTEYHPSSEDYPWGYIHPWWLVRNHGPYLSS